MILHKSMCLTLAFGLLAVSTADAAQKTLRTIKGGKGTSIEPTDIDSLDDQVHNGSPNSGLNTGGAGISIGKKDKAPKPNPKSGGASGGCTQPKAPSPVSGTLMGEKNLSPAYFTDVAFNQGKAWLVFQRGGEILLYSASPHLKDFALYKRFPMEHHAYPRISSACGALWMVYFDETRGEARLWRSDTNSIETLGKCSGATFPVAINKQYVAWVEPGAGRPVKRRSLLGGTAAPAGTTETSGLSRISDDGKVIGAEQDRRAVTWGNVAAYAGKLTVAEDKDDHGVVVQLGSTRATFWDGELTHQPRAAADGAGLYAVTAWPGVKFAVFNEAGLLMTAKALDAVSRSGMNRPAAPKIK